MSSKETTVATDTPFKRDNILPGGGDIELRQPPAALLDSLVEFIAKEMEDPNKPLTEFGRRYARALFDSLLSMTDAMIRKELLMQGLDAKQQLDTINTLVAEVNVLQDKVAALEVGRL